MRSMIPALSLSLLLCACAHKKAEEEPPRNATNAQSEAAQQAAAAAAAAAQAGQTCSDDQQCGDGYLCIDQHCVKIHPGMAECAQATVHFDFDSDVIHEGENSGLQRMARCLRADHVMHVTIQGHADERGTQEYNLALGDRRATAVSRYLRRLGASDQQLRTVSYGKEDPLCADHEETCWQKNRRAALEPR